MKFNINIAALIVLNYECLKDYIVTQPRTFYNNVEIKDGKLYCKETKEYKREVKSLEGNIDCFVELVCKCRCYYGRGLCFIPRIRRRRNDIIHNLLKICIMVLAKQIQNYI